MAVPTNEQIQDFFTNLNWQEPVIHRVATLPPYPGANVGDRYLVTTGVNKDKIFECTIPRRWAGATVSTPSIGMLVADTSTGEFWTYTGTAWTLAQPYFEQIGVLITTGGGGVFDGNILYEPLIITSAADVTAAQGYRMIFGGVTITSSFVGEILLPNLHYVSGPILSSVTDPASGMTKLELPELVTCDGDIDLFFPVAMNTLSLPKLKYARKFVVVAGLLLTEISLPELVRINPGGDGVIDYPAGSVLIWECTLLETISIPNLTFCYALYVQNNQDLTGASFSTLQSITGGLNITDNPKLTLFDLDVLERVTGNIRIEDNILLTPTSLGAPLVLPLLSSSDPSEPGNLTVTGNQTVGSGLTDVVITGLTGLATRLTTLGWAGVSTCNNNDPLP